MSPALQKIAAKLERLMSVGEELAKESTKQSSKVVILTIIVIVSGGIAADIRG